MIEEHAKNMKVKHFKISAKTGEGVQDLFLATIDAINDKIANYRIIDLIEEMPAAEE